MGMIILRTSSHSEEQLVGLHERMPFEFVPWRFKILSFLVLGAQTILKNLVHTHLAGDESPKP